MNSFTWIFTALFTALLGFIIWIAQKHVERKMKICEDAVAALSRYQSEGFNYEFQNEQYKQNKANKLLMRKKTPYLTDETILLIERSKALVPKYFSHGVASSYVEALGMISLEEYSHSGSDTEIRPVGMLSIPELNDLIHNLNKEVTISYIIFKSWLRKAH
jgi:hypothetical protein